MPRFKSGSEIAVEFQMKDFELVEFVRKGIEPLDRFGKPTVVKSILHKMLHHVGLLDERLALLAADPEQDPKVNRLMIEMLQSEKVAVLGVLNAVSEQGWSAFELPNSECDQQLATEIIEILAESLYPVASVITFLGESSRIENFPSRGNEALDSQEASAKPLLPIPPSRIDRTEIEKFVCEKWQNDGSSPRTTTAMISLVLKNPDWSKYAERTLREWISPLHPNYVPGRKGRRPTI